MRSGSYDVYFKLILEHMLFVFVKCLLAQGACFCESCTLSRLVYNGQFSSVTIYKVNKCMMSSVLKICSDWGVWSSEAHNCTILTVSVVYSV